MVLGNTYNGTYSWSIARDFFYLTFLGLNSFAAYFPLFVINWQWFTRSFSLMFCVEFLALSFVHFKNIFSNTTDYRFISHQSSIDHRSSSIASKYISDWFNTFFLSWLVLPTRVQILLDVRVPGNIMLSCSCFTIINDEWCHPYHHHHHHHHQYHVWLKLKMRY
jgi:hypothetical protein